MSGDLANIISRLTRIGSSAPACFRVAASAAECQALAAVFGLPGIAELTGDFTLVPAQGRSGIIEAELTLHATVTQICVLSLEAFEATLAEVTNLRFVPAASLREDAEIAELNRESLEGPDEIPYTGESIDLGAALAEQLALSLDPYPRKPGAAFLADAGDSASPFAALAARQPRRRDPG